jgi:hypothetical protein
MAVRYKSVIKETRKNFVLDESEALQLKALAAKMGVSESECIRESIRKMSEIFDVEVPEKSTQSDRSQHESMAA